MFGCPIGPPSLICHLGMCESNMSTHAKVLLCFGISGLFPLFLLVVLLCAPVMQVLHAGIFIVERPKCLYFCPKIPFVQIRCMVGIDMRPYFYEGGVDLFGLV